FVFIRDISEQKRAEAKLKESELTYRTIAANLPGSCVYLLDADYTFLLIEGDFVEKLGYSREALVGKKAVDVLSPEIYSWFKLELEKVFNGEPFTNEAVRGEYDVKRSFVPIMDE